MKKSVRLPSVTRLAGTSRLSRVHLCLVAGVLAAAAGLSQAASEPPEKLPKLTVARDGRSFVDARDRRFVPFGANYFRPGTGWAPQVWKQFDPAATRRDFEIMRSLGFNCVRVFLTYGSFYWTDGQLDSDGLAKFDQFLDLAEAHGLYVHPTGPDHWEGLPRWAQTDRIADERSLGALERFWSLFASRYRGRTAIFAYDLLNEPEVGWDSEPMVAKWNDWLTRKYGAPENALKAWRKDQKSPSERSLPPKAENSAGNPELLDYQLFREEIADEWTRRQVAAIRKADPAALVTVGLIQWSVPALLPGVRHYSAFNPDRQARFLDFLEVHFYPLESGALEYRNDEEELRNLAYLHAVVREVARPGKPVVLAEFGWYGGGKPAFDGAKHPAATEDQQARWGRRAVETTAGLANGWLNWGLYDQPQATDVSELSGLLKPDGSVKAWGKEAGKLARLASQGKLHAPSPALAETLPWELCITSTQEGAKFRERYLDAFRKTATR